MVRSIDGFYVPSFFYIKLDTQKKLNEIINTEEESTFIHEYIHMLQDISLVCTRNILWQNVNRFRAFSKEIRENNKKNRPIHLSSKNDIVNTNVFTYLWGGNYNVDKAVINDISIGETDLGNGIITKDIILHLTDDKENRINYKVGRCDFLENMAYEIENYIYPSVELPDFPYKTIRKILEFKGIQNSNYIVSQICELALSSFHPVEALIIFLSRTKGITQTDVLYSDMYDDITIRNYDGSIITKEEIDKKAFSDSLAMVKDWFKSPAVSVIGTWIDNILTIGEKFRNENIVYISDIITKDREEARKIIYQHIVTTGIPVVFNKEYIPQQIDPNMTKANTFLLLALDELYSYVQDTRLHCNLTEFCKKSNESLVNENCYCDIIKQTERDGLCPISVWITIFGFKDIK